MADIDPWLPIGWRIGSNRLGPVKQAGLHWQIYSVGESVALVLVARPDLVQSWSEHGLLPTETTTEVALGSSRFLALVSGPDYVLSALHLCPSPASFTDAMSFATSLKRTRELAADASLDHGIFVEQYSVILPDFTSPRTLDDATLLGRYLTGGVPISVAVGSRLSAVLTWLPPVKIREVCTAAGLSVAPAHSNVVSAGPARREEFRLPGRPALEAFLREHIIDIVEQPERYRRLGIDFPGAVVLHGPPGTGKTFAVDRLADYLGWPRFDISSESIGSPYIHDTGRKVAAIFSAAVDRAPSIVVIDEMEAFLMDRGSPDGSSAHRVEEVAEFLRRIPVAAKQQVLIVAMTNRLDTIDPAILRRGRFDHIIEVGVASSEEIEGLFRALLADLPHTEDVDPRRLVKALAGHPLSDVAFVLREAGRLAARQGRDMIDMETLQQALASAARPTANESDRPRIGFTQ